MKHKEEFEAWVTTYEYKPGSREYRFMRKGWIAGHACSDRDYESRRCENCKWNNNGDCKNEMLLGSLSMEFSYILDENFSCRYWEPKE